MPRRPHSVREWLEISKTSSSDMTAPTTGHRTSGFFNASTPNSGNARRRRRGRPPTCQAKPPHHRHHQPHRHRPPTSQASRPTWARPQWISRQPRSRQNESASIRNAEPEVSSHIAKRPAITELPVRTGSVAPSPWRKPRSRLHRFVSRKPQEWKRTTPMPHGWHSQETSRISLIFCLLSG